MINYKTTIKRLAEIAREMNDIKQQFNSKSEYPMRTQAFAISEQLYALMYSAIDYAEKED